jgi:hypothetical protein
VSIPVVAPRLRSGLVVAGGLLFAAGNLMHPPEHSDSAETHALWAAAHLGFAAGAILIAAGMPAVTARLRTSRVGLAGVALTWLSMLLILPGAWFEVFAAPVLPTEVSAAIEASAIAIGATLGIALPLGLVLLGIGVLRARAAHPAPAVGLVVAGVLLLAVPALADPGLLIIVATALTGVSVAGVGASLRSPTGARTPAAPMVPSPIG